MCHDGAKGLVSPETASALDALLQLAIEKASETLMSGELEPKDTIAAVKIIAEASKAASECVAKGNGVMCAPPEVKDSRALREPIYTFNDAVTAVCELDPETAYLEPWARVLSRINRLFQKVQKDVEEINSDRVQSSQQNNQSRVGRADQPGSGNEGIESSELNECPDVLTDDRPQESSAETKCGVKTSPTRHSDSPFMSQSKLKALRAKAPT